MTQPEVSRRRLWQWLLSDQDGNRSAAKRRVLPEDGKVADLHPGFWQRQQCGTPSSGKSEPEPVIRQTG